MTETMQELLITAQKLIAAVTVALEKEQEVSKTDPLVIPDKLSGKVTITVKELAEAMGIGIGQAYNLVHMESFPKIKVGNRYVVPVKEFRSWIEENAGISA